jgi:5-methylcytosine-specific restriction protein A
LELAFQYNLPVIGVLKDVRSHLCSMGDVFDCSIRKQIAGKAMWLRLYPRRPITCKTESVHVDSDRLVPESMQGYARRLEASVIAAQNQSAEERSARLLAAPPHPRRLQLMTVGFERNPDVVVEVLLRANGICELCKLPAPFVRRLDGSPYLEVHHRTRLADGGEDTVGNAVAVCPNCHRKAHYG